jgi:hypothetical protein
MRFVTRSAANVVEDYPGLHPYIDDMKETVGDGWNGLRTSFGACMTALVGF